MKTRQLLAGAVFAAATCVSSVALAQGYVGAGVGQTDADVDCAGTTSCDTKDTAFKLFGGYMFTPNFGVEGAYVDLGKVTAGFTDNVLGDVTGRFKSSGVAVYGVGAWQIEQFELFGKLGFATLKTKVDATSSTAGSASDSDTKTTFAWGIGGGYNFSKNFGARLEWERFQPKFEGEKTDVDVLSVSVLYRF